MLIFKRNDIIINLKKILLLSETLFYTLFSNLKNSNNIQVKNLIEDNY